MFVSDFNFFLNRAWLSLQWQAKARVPYTVGKVVVTARAWVIMLWEKGKVAQRSRTSGGIEILEPIEDYDVLCPSSGGNGIERLGADGSSTGTGLVT